MRKKWSPTEIAEVLAKYSDHGSVRLSAELGRSKDSISGIARRYGIRSASRRKRQGVAKAERSKTVNPRFFDQPGREVAYVLGWLWACGGLRLSHRLALRIACGTDRREKLAEVQALLGSRHSIQHHPWRSVVEICNSRLVQSLIENFGHPPGKSNPNPSMPSLAPELLPSYARGHLDANGCQRQQVLRWNGRQQEILEMSAGIQLAADVGVPCLSQYGRRCSIAWTEAKDVRRLRQWLRLGEREHD